MGRRNARPLTIRPKGLSDAIDGSNAFKGAMQLLQNLVPSASTAQVFVPRPASVELTDFAGFTVPAGITALLVIGTRAYGMISSSQYPGRDQPFCYDIVAGAFVAISGQSSASLPSTQPTTGDWQPPHMEMIANRIIVTHPGFSGGSGPFFGWIDVTGFSQATLKGNTTIGSPVIRSINGDGASTPILDGIQPGQVIAMTGFVAGTKVLSATNGTADISTTGDTHSNTTIDNVPASAVTASEVGMYITGGSIPAGAYITAKASGTSWTISAAATATAAAVPLQVIGGGTITVDNNSSAANNLQTFTAAGGSFAAPVWGSGNTNVNPLKAVPKWVSQFNGRAWYAVNNAEVFSDSLLPLNVSLATQVLTLGDNQDVTCSSGLPLNNITTGGIVQSLIAFKGDAIMYQITGDQATNNLSINALNVSVGTLAPNTICPSPLGLAFVAPDGLRIIDFSARVSDPLGANGAGVSVPFVNALTPSRMAAAFNQNVLRISCQNSQAANQPVLEYWLHLNEALKIWTGPHTFPASYIQPDQAPAGAVSGHGFISVGYGVDAKLWESGVNPISSDIYIENGVQLTWTYQTVLEPDTDLMAQNRMGQSAVAMALPGGQTISFSCVNEIGTVMNQVTISAVGSAPSTWGSFTWGGAPWGQATGYFRQYNIPWTAPIIFKQMSILSVGSSQAGMAIGNLYLKYQPLGYLLNVLGAA
jgi:hypothetical protein